MQAQVISFHCVLKDKVGTVISSTFNKDVITETQDGFLRGLLEGLKNLKAGEKRRIHLAASDAYGYYYPHLTMVVLRSRFPHGSTLTIGDQILISRKRGKLKTYRVVEVSEKKLNLDGNHPLAGLDLIFEIEGVQSREATSDELYECSREIQDPCYN